MKAALHVEPLQTYTIGDLCNEFELTARAIRFYEEQGLISPARDRDRRVYSPADRQRLDFIARGRRVGLSIPQIRQILNAREEDGEEAQSRLALSIFDDQLRELSEQEAQIQRMIATLHAERERLLNRIPGERPPGSSRTYSIHPCE